MEHKCDCALYDDLPLDMSAILDRVDKYKTMRPKLRQISQKVVERWIEHYRLYECEVCGQYWQSTLAPRDDENWYVFKVPEITQKAWRESPYIAPDMIVEYLTGKAKYMANNFGTREELCNAEGCNEKAISGLNKCVLHQFLQIGGKKTYEALLNMRWFGSYNPEIIKH